MAKQTSDRMAAWQQARAEAAERAGSWAEAELARENEERHLVVPSSLAADRAAEATERARIEREAFWADFNGEHAQANLLRDIAARGTAS